MLQFNKTILFFMLILLISAEILFAGLSDDSGKADLITAATGQIHAGFGEAGIIPDWPVLLSYGRQKLTTAAFDTARVKVLMLKVREVTVALVECDAIGIRRRDAEFIKAKISRAAGIGPQYIIVAATHSHSYPRAYKKKIRNFIAAKAARAALLAKQNMFPAKIGFGKRHIREDLNLNRAELNGIANSLLYVIRFEDYDGNLRGVFYNYGTHPTMFTAWGNHRGQMGPNWPGLVNRKIHSRLEQDLYYQRYDEKKDIPVNPFVMFSEGAAGDQQPRINRTEYAGKTVPGKKVFTETLADEVLDLLENTAVSGEVELSFSSRMVNIPVTGKKEKQSLLQVLRIDSTVIATVPGELGVDLARKFEKESPFSQNMLITNANDYIGYIVPEHLALEKVTYQAKGDYYHPHYGVFLIDELLKMVDEKHPSTPPLPAAKLFGKISGRVFYEGEHKIAIGAKRIPSRPNYGGGFWGKRVVADSAGCWEIDRLMPGTFYLYGVEADREQPAPEKLKSSYRDVRTLFYGYPVTVQAGSKTEHVDFALPADFAVSDVTALRLAENSLVLNGNTLHGAVEISGKPGADDKIIAGAYPADQSYRKPEVFLKNPVVTTEVSTGGNFTIESLPPGRYRIVCLLDVNHNLLPEFKIDVISKLTDSPVIIIGEQPDNSAIR